MLGDALVVGVAHQTQSGELPLGLGRQTVVRIQDAVGLAHLTLLATIGGVEVVEALAGLTLVAASQIDIGLESIGTQVLLVKQDDTPIDQHLLVHAVGTPGAVLLGLLPGDTHHGIVGIVGAAEVVVHKTLAPSQAVAPAGGVGHDGGHLLGIFLTVGALHPIDELAVVKIAHLALVHIERRHGDGVRVVVPRVARILGHVAHDETPPLDEHQAGSCALLGVTRHIKATPIGVIVFPTRRG